LSLLKIIVTNYEIVWSDDEAQLKPKKTQRAANMPIAANNVGKGCGSI
jgi:hypothetical protein